MENKKIKINLQTLLLIIAVIIILILLAIIYVQDGKLKDEIKMREDRVTEYVISNNVEVKEDPPKEDKKEYVIDTTDKDIEYEDYITSKDNVEALYITEAIKNNDKTYTLRGIGVKEYSFNKKYLENKFEKDDEVTLYGRKYVVSEPEKDDEEDNDDVETVYELKEKENNNSKYKIIKEKENVYKLERTAQYSRVDTFDTKYYEVTVPEDMIITVGNEFSGLESTVKEQFGKYKTIKVQLTKEELDEKLLDDSDYQNIYIFTIEDKEVKGMIKALLGV